VNPGAIELCNNIDDNCRGGTDEEFPGKGDACWRKIGSTCWRGRVPRAPGPFFFIVNWLAKKLIL